MTRDSDGSYRLGPGVVALARAYLTQTDLHTEFDRLTRGEPVLPEETLLLSVRDGSDVVYIGRRIGSRPVAVSYELGLRLPAHCTASGKALLAALPADEARRLYPLNTRLPPLTPQSITDVSALMRELAETRARGYAIDNEELATGMMCVGVAVPDRTGQAVGAVAVGMVKAAMTDSTLPKAVAEMQRLADSISLGLGATAPASQSVAPSS
jgi:DNA-binding IclR family transcriptional regulator